MNSEMAAPRLDPALQFMRLMWFVDHGLQKASKRMSSSIGLTGPQRLAVRIVGRYPGIAAGELASVMHLDPSTVTGILRRLERSRMILRGADPIDGRRVRLSLTPKGRETDRRMAGTVEAAVRRTIGLLSHQEVDAASHMLTVLASQLLTDDGAGRRRRART
jgi:MarR family transcriptional regulator, organic hydroperoxide resistance regulator